MAIIIILKLVTLNRNKRFSLQDRFLFTLPYSSLSLWLLIFIQRLKRLVNTV